MRWAASWQALLAIKLPSMADGGDHEHEDHADNCDHTADVEQAISRAEKSDHGTIEQCHVSDGEENASALTRTATNDA